uniref:Uncharacterized protein n=1 Tax=Ditylenchus dipsaci TaxID=166011 RepID=A0A915DK40_9BILA
MFESTQLFKARIVYTKTSRRSTPFTEEFYKLMKDFAPVVTWLIGCFHIQNNWEHHWLIANEYHMIVDSSSLA